MIGLTKGPKPAILDQQAAQWTQELLAKLNSNEKATYQQSRYRHDEIKNSLIAETSGKCAYCESKMRHVAYGDIEHIIPKSFDPARSFDWNNLTLACDICNTNKAANHIDILDPYNSDPSDHLFIEGPLVLPMPASDPGRVTERTLELNRPDLVERRKEKLVALLAQIEIWARETNPRFKKVLWRDIKLHETASSKEYAALARHLVSRLLPQQA